MTEPRRVAGTTEVESAGSWENGRVDSVVAVRAPDRPRTSTTGQPVGSLPHSFWFATLLSVALVLAGGSLAIGAYTAAGRPDTVVREYFAALQRGNAAAALGYGNPPAGPVGLISATVLARQNAIGPIENVTVLDVRQSGPRATVDVDYTVDLRTGPVTKADQIPVEQVGHGWRLTRSAVDVTLYAGTGSDLASIANAPVPTGLYPMFPGAVPVTYDSPNLGLVAGARVVGFSDENSILEIDATVTPAGRAAIAPAVTSALAACLAGTSPTEELCPLPDEVAGVPGSLRGTATGPVRLTFQVGTASGQINIDGSAPVSGSYRELDENDIAVPTSVQSTQLSAVCDPARPGRIWWAGS